MRSDMYLYICKDDTGRFFATCGNFKTAYMKPCDVFQISSEPVMHWNISPFGYVSNVSSDIRLKDVNFKVIYQYNYDDLSKYRRYYAGLNKYRAKKIVPFIHGMRLFSCYERGMYTLSQVLEVISI